MKDFVFSIQSVSDMTQSNVKQQRILLKNIEAKLMEVEAEIHSTVVEISRVQDQFSEAVEKGISATDAMHYKRYTTQLKDFLVALEQKKNGFEQEKTDCLKELIAIRKDQKVLDKLEQKEFEAYKKQVKRENSKITDDLFTHKVSVS